VFFARAVVVLTILKHLEMDCFMRMANKLVSKAFIAVAIWGAAGAVNADVIVVQSTTSTQNSGLLDAILPQFEDFSGHEVRVVAVGTGQALRNAQNGDGDILLVHAKSAEEQFVADGWGVQRFDVMYNDFVLVGPRDDPAKIGNSANIETALQTLAGSKQPFASRGDDSGTHKAELRLWSAAGINHDARAQQWYRETGSGMGATLNVALGMGAYVLTDRATWIAFGNTDGMAILAEGDPRLFNQYGVIAVNPTRHPHVAASAAQELVDWLIGADGQAAIAAYRLHGQQLFFPNATR
jgi:tungstate transport system substrate-binding protein